MSDWEFIKGSPILCVECDYVDIRDFNTGHSYLFCNKLNKRVYNYSRPKWCPIPLWRNKKIGELRYE